MEKKKKIILPVKSKWFQMEKAGIKPEDYREIKPYFDLANHILKRYGICEDLRFRPMCEKCIRLKGELIS